MSTTGNYKPRHSRTDSVRMWNAGANHRYTNRLRHSGSDIPKQKKLNLRLLILYGWITIMGLVGLQGFIPFYMYLFVFVTMLLIIAIATGGHDRSHAALGGLIYILVIYTLATVVRSDLYSPGTQIKLFVRLSIFMLPAIAIPVFVKERTQARDILLFVLLYSGLLALSAPLQEFTGRLWWLYSTDNWELLHGRGGYARYLSIFGDPNVSGIIGGLLPLTLLVLRRQKFRFSIILAALEIVIWGISLILVAYSLSFTGMIVFLISSASVWWLGRGYRFRQFIEIILLIVFGYIVVPQIGDMLSVVMARTIEPFSSYYLRSGSSLGFIEGNLMFRLLSGFDLNNTFMKILFGSTYNVVVPSSSYNTFAILAHNAYKEIYLAGGILGLVIFLSIIFVTGTKAVRLIKHNKRAGEISGTALASAITFIILAFVMFTFPVYHYSGIGLIFWVAVGLIHVIHNKFETPNENLDV